MKRDNNENNEVKVGVGYPAFQLAKALANEAATVSQNSKSAKWIQAIKGMLSGDIKVGERTPVKSIPAWATLEVLTGGFATGNLLAGGKLTNYECELLEKLNLKEDKNARLNLNQYFITEEGVCELQRVLENGCYVISVPEEAALLCIAALLKKDNPKDAQKILEEITPFFDRIRFYPKQTTETVELPESGEVFVQSVGQVKAGLNKDKQNKLIIGQKNSIEVWRPFYDEMIDLLVDSYSIRLSSCADSNSSDVRPFSRINIEWLEKREELLIKYESLKSSVPLSKKWSKSGSQFAKLLEAITQFSSESVFLEKHAKYVHQAVQRYLKKHGLKNSESRRAMRELQQLQCKAPEHRYLKKVLVERLSDLEQFKGLTEIDGVSHNTTENETLRGKIPVNTSMPNYLVKKLERAKVDSIENLIKKRVITSGDTVAGLLPQISGDVLSDAFKDENLKRLFRNVYVSFRKRRSLLLLNLQSQVKIGEIPWLKALERYRDVSVDVKSTAERVLEEIVKIALFNFPQAIIPNKLLQELRSLLQRSELDLPMVDEVAADIFMGEFSSKFAKSAFIAARHLKGSLYEKYYAIDYSQILEECAPSNGAWTSRQANSFSKICNERVSSRSNYGWSVAANGVVIEQQQIITTQNMAQLLGLFDLKLQARENIEKAVMSCFSWICRRQQMKITDYHAKLVMVKNTAYAWRQMILFLSQFDREEQIRITKQLQAYLDQQTEVFREKFDPILSRLSDLVNDEEPRIGYIFTGWTTVTHRLLREKNEQNSNCS